MRIDNTIYDAIDAGTLTIDQVLASFVEAFFKNTMAEAIADGFAEADVAAIEEYARSFRDGSVPATGGRIDVVHASLTGCLETIRQMLESRAQSLQ